MSNLLKDRPIAQGVIGNAIFQIIWNGGSGVMSFITGRLALAQGYGPLWAIIIGVFIFLVLVIIGNLMHLVYVRQRRYSREVASDPVQPNNKTSVNDLKGCDDVWLHEIAERQKQALQDYAYIECWLHEFDVLHNSLLYIDFRFRILNSSVYKLSFKSIEGRIHFGKKAFHNTPTIESNEFKNIRIGEIGWLTVRQPLKPEEAGELLHNQKGFNFQFLQIELKGEPGGIESGPVHINSNIDNKRVLSETPEVTMEVLETKVDGLYDRETYPEEPSPELGSVLNIRVKIQNLRPVPVEIKRFILQVHQKNIPAQEGQICDITLLQFGEIKQTRNPLKNLNNCPFYLDPKSDLKEGWLQFIVRDVESRFWRTGSSVKLIALDSRDENHSLVFHPSFTISS